MIDLSIIVPVYNVEEYLEECLKSIVSIKDVDAEIICIDDCSTDSSSDILNKYDNYNNIKVVKNKNNRGLASSRNEGLKYADGQFVLFVDSDDFINPDSIKAIVHKAIEDSLDVLYFDVEEFGNLKGIDTNRRKRKYRYEISDGVTILDQMIRNHEMFGSVWSALYRRSFLCDENIRFIDGILHEDIPYTFEVLNKAKRVSVINELGYFYRQREKSILHQNNYLNRATGLIVGYSKLVCIWHETMQKGNVLLSVASVDTYLASILSMIHSNISKAGVSDYKEYPIVNHIANNLKFNEYAKYNMIFDDCFWREIMLYNSIAMYGAGNIATELLQYFELKKIKISKLFVTKKIDKKKLLYANIETYTPEKGERYDAIILAVSKQYEDEIFNYLINNEYQGKIFRLSI
ncbi:MAG: glycosyltransferase [Selenomonadaceae bacterium]